MLLDLTNGKAFRRLDLGTGAAARVTSSARVIMLVSLVFQVTRLTLSSPRTPRPQYTSLTAG